VAWRLPSPHDGLDAVNVAVHTFHKHTTIVFRCGTTDITLFGAVTVRSYIHNDVVVQYAERKKKRNKRNYIYMSVPSFTSRRFVLDVIQQRRESKRIYPPFFLHFC
jgi:hypothetical protein